MGGFLMSPRTQRVFTGLAITLLVLTGLIDPVYSASLGAALLVAYGAIVWRQSKVGNDSRRHFPWKQP
jgi:hypothetical protein